MTYKEVNKALGYSKSRVCEAIKWLKKNLLLFIVSVHKKNENVFGQAFVDGKLYGRVRKATEYVAQKFTQKTPSATVKPIKNPFKGKFGAEFERMIARAAIEKQFQSA